MKKIPNKIPISVLAKLYDQTGCHTGGMKGYYLFFIDKDGNPCVSNQFENNATKLALTASMKQFLEAYDAQVEFQNLLGEFDFEEGEEESED